ncbi:MAG TPA: transposase [Bacteroidia bacterium]|nr:transposase [Bacteroidia bacterium]
MSGDRYYIRDQNAIYFLTFTVVNWLDVFSRMNHKTAIVDSLNYCIDNKGLTVHAWCLMTNHLHLLASAREGYELSPIIRVFKEHTAKEVIKLIEEEPESKRENFLEIFKSEGKKDKRITKYKFWQESNHAIELKPFRPNFIDQKLNYIHYNPAEEGIVAIPEDYLYSSARD